MRVRKERSERGTSRPIMPPGGFTGQYGHQRQDAQKPMHVGLPSQLSQASIKPDDDAGFNPSSVTQPITFLKPSQDRPQPPPASLLLADYSNDHASYW
jgi:hypothetical protein